MWFMSMMAFLAKAWTNVAALFVHQEFTEMPYEELISQKTGFSEYIKMRNKKHNGN
jgi:hypothetical protein